MNRHLLLTALTVAALGACRSTQAPARLPEKAGGEQLDLRTYQRVDTINYTGAGYLKLLSARKNYSLVSFVFEAGGRNRWHLHPGAEQVLYVTEGEGYYQQEGQPKQLLKKGDTVVIPPDVKHWNGATPTSRVVLITISDHVEQAHVTWFEQVSEQEFNK
ncbi:cupin domain-containing protein [Hymenobacter metallicola]|uniref:Cupin domain-containing protein n=1 Tax=Hymenobacter metallicola TaxID=2563114 RepID=A0A4Z0Q0V3_9BACT|nr:cupin domain-containing protein [Hymenobacter metallicola]